MKNTLYKTILTACYVTSIASCSSPLHVPVKPAPPTASHKLTVITDNVPIKWQTPLESDPSLTSTKTTGELRKELKRKKRTALQLADGLEEVKNKEGVQILLEYGAKPRASSLFIFDDDIVSLMIEYGAISPKGKDPEGIYYAFANHPIALQWVLDHGGNPNQKGNLYGRDPDKNGETLADSMTLSPLMRMFYQSRWEEDDLYALAKILLDHGADVNARDDDGLPVICYTQKQFNKLTHLLKQYGANMLERRRFECLGAPVMQ